jgi:hypothetical protein
VFYILAVEKERLKALKQWFRLKSNQVIEIPSNDGSGPSHDIIVSRVMMPLGQDGPRHRGSTSQAGAGRQDQAMALDPSLLPHYVIEYGDSAM